MNIAEAKKIAEHLGNGINPLTGEMLPPDNILHNSKIIRALLTLAHKTPVKKQSRSLSNAAKNLPTNTGKKWDQVSETRLIEMFNKGKSMVKIAAQFERTKGAIRSRLVKLGLIEDDRNKAA
ncbi:hypothetical protein N9Z27_02615 [Alphaproteobacteria bacterium]|nr:hypothetical protein [Alphaproteobacteria bacterium]